MLDQNSGQLFQTQTRVPNNIVYDQSSPLCMSDERSGRLCSKRSSSQLWFQVRQTLVVGGVPVSSIYVV